MIVPFGAFILNTAKYLQKVPRFDFIYVILILVITLRFQQENTFNDIQGIHDKMAWMHPTVTLSMGGWSVGQRGW